MTSPISLDINIKSDTANKILDIISQAGYALYEPTKIRNIAAAKKDALLIKAKGSIEKTYIERQAIARIASIEIVRQDNINKIAKKALDNVTDSGKKIDENTESDWIRKYFNLSQDVSNEEMQNIWSKILAGEFIQSGSFSYKTLSILANMRQGDAQIFSKLCSYVVTVKEGRYVPLIFSDGSNGTYNNKQFSFEDMQYLDSLGLIHFDNIASYNLTVFEHAEILVDCCNQLYVIKNDSGKFELSTGSALLAREGIELLKVIHIEPARELLDILMKNWITNGRTILKYIG